MTWLFQPEWFYDSMILKSTQSHQMLHAVSDTSSESILAADCEQLEDTLGK